MVDILSGATASRSIGQAPLPRTSSSVANPSPADPLPANRSAPLPGALANVGGTAAPVPADFYLNPSLRFDAEAFRVIFEVRDSNSGEVKRRFPAESAVSESGKPSGLAIEIPQGRQVPEGSAVSAEDESSPGLQPPAPVRDSFGPAGDINLLI